MTEITHKGKEYYLVEGGKLPSGNKKTIKVYSLVGFKLLGFFTKPNYDSYERRKPYWTFYFKDGLPFYRDISIATALDNLHDFHENFGNINDHYYLHHEETTHGNGMKNVYVIYQSSLKSLGAINLNLDKKIAYIVLPTYEHISEQIYKYHESLEEHLLYGIDRLHHLADKQLYDKVLL